MRKALNRIGTVCLATILLPIVIVTGAIWGAVRLVIQFCGAVKDSLIEGEI